MKDERTAFEPAKPHVVHVIGTLRTGGAEKQLVNYLLASNRDDFRHTVLCLTERGEFADAVERSGIDVRVARVRTRRLPLDLWSLARWLRREQVRVVHSHMHASSLWGRLAGLMAGVPVLVTTEHGKENWKGRWRIAVDRFLSRFTWRHTAVSQDIVDIRLRRERMDPERVLLVPNGVPVPDPACDLAAAERCRVELGIAPGRPVIGSVGRVAEAKAYHDLLAAVAILRRDHPDLCWLQIGEGPLEGELAAAVERDGLQENVVMTGRREDIGDLLGVMDVWVMSSVREGLPVSLLEAMAAARPIAATDVGGIPDAVTDGESALLVPARDPEALANAVGRLLDDTELARRLAAAAQKRVVADYSIEAVARRLESVYSEGLAVRG